MFIIASDNFLSALEEVLNFINDCYFSSTDNKGKILMAGMNEKVESYRSNIAKVRLRYRDGTLYPENPFAQSREEARIDGRNIASIAGANGFKVLEAYSNGHAEFGKILVGDVHYSISEPTFLRYHENIADIVFLMASQGVLKPKDSVCVESSLAEGKVDLSSSTVSGGTNKIVVQNCQTRYAVTVDNRHFIARAFDFLRFSGIDVVYNGSVETGKKYDEARAKHRKTMTPETEQEEIKAFVERIESFGRSLSGINGRAVQVLGMWDLFPGIIQKELKQKGESYMTIVPEEGLKAMLELNN